ncbi:hypothetical protein Tsubulata_002546 [Turnera subulata]|uniref:Methyltransferase type 11 domain-containing protein n=1 Tax=Turnera subulata TaxID=218843 RepID=A0A9Q0JKJ4_9ROSI|nr:hypothetical protein Tsubulata_002546 [Turnera subulata]
MGKKGKQSQKSTAEDILETLGDFTSKENWDNFFRIRGTDDSFEWYAEWPQLRHSLLPILVGPDSPDTTSTAGTTAATTTTAGPTPTPPQILVPGCGNSRLSEHLYDAGYKEITNVDFSKVVISDMLRRNVRDRPGMLWRVMDMTAMQFAEKSFDVVLDKGGLDALMEPELGPKLGDQYLSEVKRVLKLQGKFICLTLAETHVLDLLFSKFRFGWKMSVQAIPQKPSSKPSLQTFMALGLREALEKENQTRNEYSGGSDILYSLQDLQLGAKGDLKELSPGCRIQFMLGGNGSSRFSYKAVLLDAKEDSGPFSFHCGVFLVPKTRAHEWLFSSEEGQWLVVDSSKSARLIMVILDSSHSHASMDDLQKDLSPLVKELAPGKDDNGAQIPFMMAGDGIKERKTVHQVASSLTGPIVVEDVIYENVDSDLSHIMPARDLVFRRLVFQRAESLVQSEALLLEPESSHKVKEGKKARSSSKSKRKGSQKRNNESSDQLTIYHDYLASSYHTGIISGLMLISSFLENVASAGRTVNAVVVGLGAGLLPMFLHGCVPFLHIEVVELDPVVLSIAKEFFGFREDTRLKAHIADGIRFIQEAKNFAEADGLPSVRGSDLAPRGTKPSNGHCSPSTIRCTERHGLDLIIIDVDSSDSSSGMTCPAADFVEESFLLTAKDTLSEQGIFVVNLVSRSPAIKDMVVSRMKMVFSHLFGLQLEEDVNMVLFGLRSENSIAEESFSDAATRLGKLLQFKNPEIGKNILDATKKICRLK